MESGASGPRGLTVTRPVTVARETDIDSVINLFLCMEELTALEIDMKQRTVIQRVVLVSALGYEYQYSIFDTKPAFLYWQHISQ